MLFGILKVMLLAVILHQTSSDLSTECQATADFLIHLLTNKRDGGRKATILVPDAPHQATGMDPAVCLSSPTVLSHVSAQTVALAWPSVSQCHRQRESCLSQIAANSLLLVPYAHSQRLTDILNQIYFNKSGLSVSIAAVFLVSETKMAGLIQLLAQLDVNMATDVHVAVFSDLQNIKVQDVYRLCRACDLIFNELYTWSRENVTVFETRSRLARRSDLRGITLNAVGVYVFQIYTKTEVQNGTLTPVGGIFYRLVRTLSEKFNFKLNITFLEGYSYGHNKGNLTYDGMVGALQFQRADLTVSELSETSERRLLIDYSEPISLLYRRVYVRLDNDVESWITRYTRGISSNMTASLFACVLLLGIVLRLSEWVITRVANSSNDSVSLYDTVWTIYGALMQQGSPCPPEFIGSRIIFITAFFTALLVYTAYSATLIAFLAARAEPQPLFTDLRGLLAYPQWRVGWKRRELIENFLKWCYDTGSAMTDCDTIRAIWERHTSEEELVDTYEEGFRKVASGQFAFVAPEEAADYVLAHMGNNVSCGVLKLSEGYLGRPIAIGLNKNSPLKPLINNGIKVLLEGGVVDKLYQDEIGEPEACSLSQFGNSGFLKASLQHTLGAFVVLLIGVIASWLIFFAEKRFFKYREKKKNETQ